MQIETGRDEHGWTMRVRRLADTRVPALIALAALLCSLNETVGVRGRAHVVCLVASILLILLTGVFALFRRTEIVVRPDEVCSRRFGALGGKSLRVSRAEVQGVSVIDGTVALVMRSANPSVPLLTGVRADDGAKILEILQESGSWLGERVMAPGLSLRS